MDTSPPPAPSTFQPLSRREEDEFQKRIKLKALEHCDPLVAAFASCSSSRTISVAWACRQEWKAVQTCMKEYMTEEKVDEVRREYMSKREELKVPYKKLSWLEDSFLSALNHLRLFNHHREWCKPNLTNWRYWIRVWHCLQCSLHVKARTKHTKWNCQSWSAEARPQRSNRYLEITTALEVIRLQIS